MIKDKKMRDSIKILHNASGATPQRSPPSPIPAEWAQEIPSWEDKLKQYEEEGICDQFGSMFSSYLGIPSAPPPYSAPMDFPPSYANFPGASSTGYYGAPPRYEMPPPFPYDPYTGGPSSSSAPSQPDPAAGSSDTFAAAAAASIFPPPSSDAWGQW